MKVAICTTTINGVTEAMGKFIAIAEDRDWDVIVAGDTITPGDVWREAEVAHPCVTYLDLGQQRHLAQELSDLIGPRCIQRRNFAMLAAARRDDVDVVAVVDDDNIPYPSWGKNLAVGCEVPVIQYPAVVAFDPLSVTRNRHVFQETPLRHRGFPVQLWRPEPEVTSMIPLVQADLWDGEPDVDAITRMVGGGELDMRYEGRSFFTGSVPGPFNSQNTFLHRSVLPYYFLFPDVGRMDDIWASYVMQKLVPNSVIYGPPSVEQVRNPHDLSKDLMNEVLGYQHTLDLITWLKDHNPLTDEWPEWMPESALYAWELWRDAL